jgi:hypothetical protein
MRGLGGVRRGPTHFCDPCSGTGWSCVCGGDARFSCPTADSSRHPLHDPISADAAGTIVRRRVPQRIPGTDRCCDGPLRRRRRRLGARRHGEGTDPLGAGGTTGTPRRVVSSSGGESLSEPMASGAHADGVSRASSSRGTVDGWSVGRGAGLLVGGARTADPTSDGCGIALCRRSQRGRDRFDPRCPRRDRDE